MRNVKGIYSKKSAHWVGDGFPVRTLLSHEQAGLAASPFLMLDYAGPHQFGPKEGKPRGAGSHPHKGFETVTIVYDGEVEHRDSTGAGGVIGPGDVQWMTAGNGILHQEYHSPEFTRTGGTFEMVQLWVNLPAADKGATPGYQNITKDLIPTFTGEGFSARVIAGAYDQVSGPTKTFTPINVWDLQVKEGAEVTLPIPAAHNTTLVVLRGAIRLEALEVKAAESVVLEAGPAPIHFSADADSLVLVLSGTPIDEPVVAYGPFVMNSEDEIRAAITDFNSGRFGRI